MMDTRELAEKLRLGSCPIMPSRDAMEAGDEIIALLDGRQIGHAVLDASTAEKVRETLVAFGALAPDDFETPPLDLLSVLLPAADFSNEGHCPKCGEYVPDRTACDCPDPKE